MAVLLELLGGATERLLADVAFLTEDADVRAPCALPGWSRGHLLTHLARNAEAHRRMALAAAGGAVARQYPGGGDQRAADIEAGAGRPAAALVEDVTASATALASAWGAMPEAAWQRPIAMLDGVVAAWVGPRSRLTECELHHVDLDVGYHPSAWSPGFVDLALPQVAARMGERARGEAEPVPRWVLHRTDGAVDAEAEWSIGTGPPAGRVTATGAALLAWLTGRGWVLGDGELAVDGDAGAARALPERLPYG